MYTCPVVRSNSKVDVWKYSLSGGQLNSILPPVVSIGSLSVIKSPTRVLTKFGTYQSRAIVPCFLDEFLNGFLFGLVQIYCGIHGWIWCTF